MRHRWLLRLTNRKAFNRFFSGLSFKEKMAIFESLAELAQAENPCAVPGVKKITASGDLWRQRQGTYRIIFHFETGEVVHLKCSYKGEIHVDRIEHRKSVYT